MKSTGLSRLAFYILIIVMTMTNFSCQKDEFGEQITSPQGYIAGPGVYVVNEGNYGSGNASLSFRHDLSGKVYQEIYRHANGHPLGDVAVSMSILHDTGIIVVNNSGMVEFVRLSTMKSIGSITGLPSPRHSVHHGKFTYVSDLMRGEIHIINRQTMSLAGSIQTGKSVENMVVINNMMYAACWSSYYVNKPNNNVLVIDLNTRAVVDSIQLSKEPNSMAVDKHGKLWVLCSGGFLFEEAPSLYAIDLSSRSVIKSYTFNQGWDYPTSLRINHDGDELYYLNMGVWNMGINESDLPATAIFQGGTYIYGLACDPASDRILAADAVDFQHAGQSYILSSQGAAIDSFPSGIGPSFFCFRTQ